MNRRHCLGLMVAAGLLFANAVAQAEPVKIGFLATMSGPGGGLGQDQYDAFMLGIEHGKDKLGAITVEVIKEDDQLKPDLGVQAVRKLIERDRVQIITGLTFSNVMMAVAKPMFDAGIFAIGSNAGPAPLAGAQCSPFLFMTSWTNDSNHQSMGTFATNMNYKRMFLLAPNYQAGKEAITGFKRVYKAPPLDEIYTQLSQLDYAAEIAQIQAAAPDAVYVFYPGAFGVSFVKQYKQAGLLGKIPLLSTSTVDGTTLPALKDTAIGVVTGSSYSPDFDNPTNKRFVADFTSKFGRIPSLYAAQSYDAAQLIVSGLAKTGGRVADKQAFRTALEAADFSSVSGPFRFNINHFPIRNFNRVDVASDGAGGAMLVNKGVVLADHRDSFYGECHMQQ